MNLSSRLAVVVCWTIGLIWSRPVVGQQVRLDTMNITFVGQIDKGDTLVSLKLVRRDLNILVESVREQRDEERRQVIRYITALQKELDDTRRMKSCRITETWDRQLYPHYSTNRPKEEPPKLDGYRKTTLPKKSDTP